MPPSTTGRASTPFARRMLAAIAARGPEPQIVTTGWSDGRSGQQRRIRRYGTFGSPGCSPRPARPSPARRSRSPRLRGARRARRSSRKGSLGTVAEHVSGDLTERDRPEPGDRASGFGLVRREHGHGRVGVEREACLRREARSAHGDVDRSRPVTGEVRLDGADVQELRAFGGTGSSGGTGSASRNGPWLSYTMRARFGGFGAEPLADSATKASSTSIVAIGLKRRSNPIVVDPGSSSPCRRASRQRVPGTPRRRRAARAAAGASGRGSSAPAAASTARSGRAASPTKSESPVSTSHGSSARVVSTTARQQCSGPVPRRVDRLDPYLPPPSSPPSTSGSCGYVDLGSGVDAHRHAVLEREPAVPEDVIGMRMGLERPYDSHHEPLGLPEDALDRERRIDQTASLASSQPTMYDAQPRSLFTSCERSTAPDASTDAAIQVEVSASQTSQHDEAPTRTARPTAPATNARPSRCSGSSCGGRRDDGQPRRPAHHGVVVVALAGWKTSVLAGSRAVTRSGNATMSSASIVPPLQRAVVPLRDRLQPSGAGAEASDTGRGHELERGRRARRALVRRLEGEPVGSPSSTKGGAIVTCPIAAEAAARPTTTATTSGGARRGRRHE